MYILRWFDRVSEAAAMDARKSNIRAARLKYRPAVGAAVFMSSSCLARGGRRRGTCKLASARDVCFTLALLLMSALLVEPALPAEAGATGQSEIRLGMSADFSASARALSIELYRGAMAYLRPINNAGGVNGRRIAITAYDDQYEPDLAIRNTLKLMDGETVFALFSYVGTPTMNRTLPLLRMHQAKDFLLFFPFTGAGTNRIPPYDQLSFNLRASYDQETKGLVDHFIAINRTRIAVFYQADAYGRAGWAGLREALAKHGLEIAGEATYSRGSPFDQSYDRQVAIMQRLQPDAVICVGTYPACAGFISLEGYLNAKLFVAILQRMGLGPRRADLAQTVLNMGDFDLGMGQPLSFGGPSGRRQASDQVYYTMVRDGRFVPLRDGEWEAWAK